MVDGLTSWQSSFMRSRMHTLEREPVDLVSHRALHVRLRDTVLAEAQVLYAA